MDVRGLADDELIAYVASLPPGASEVLDEALDELFARMRSEATAEKLAYVEAVIARLRWTLRDSGADGGPIGGTGVREPRRPAPAARSAAVEMMLPADQRDAA